MGRGYLAIAKQIAEGNSITQDDVSYKLIEETRDAKTSSLSCGK
jgi:hypothetical protein